MKTSASISSSPPARLVLVAALLLTMTITSCSRVHRPGGVYMGRLVASWYGPGFDGQRSASGEKYDMDALTAAHRELPFGTKLMLIDPKSKAEVAVTVNDRGPYVDGRDIDLSRAAAAKLGIVGRGTGAVDVYNVGRDMRYVSYMRHEYEDADGPFTIQVASFGDRAGAEAQAAKLGEHDKEVYVSEADVDGRKFFRVRIGKYGTRAAASFYARRLAVKGFDGLSIIKY